MAYRKPRHTILHGHGWHLLQIDTPATSILPYKGEYYFPVNTDPHRCHVSLVDMDPLKLGGQVHTIPQKTALIHPFSKRELHIEDAHGPTKDSLPGPTRDSLTG